MTNQEILTNVLKIAVKNGYQSWKIQWMQDMVNNLDTDFLMYGYKILLTDHELCKALWGTKRLCPDCKRPVDVEDPENNWCYPCDKGFFKEDTIENWRFQLQCMVVTDNWLKHIEQQLEGKL